MKLKIDKPRGVIAACILLCVLGVIDLFFGLIALTLGSHLPLVGIPRAAFLAIVTVIGIALLATVYGLWNLRRWAYFLGIGALSLDLIISIFVLVNVADKRALLDIGVDLVLILLMLSKEVRLYLK